MAGPERKGAINTGKVLEAWASGAEISPEECDRLALRRQQCQSLNQALSRLLVTKEGEKDLATAFSPAFVGDIAGKNLYRPVAAFVEWMKAKSKTDASCDVETFSDQLYSFLGEISKRRDSLLPPTPALVHEIASLIFTCKTSDMTERLLSRQLARVGKPTRDALAPMLEDPGATHRFNALKVLGAMQCAEMRPLFDRIETLAQKDPDQRVKRHAEHVSNIIYFCRHAADEEPIAPRPLPCLKGEPPYPFAELNKQAAPGECSADAVMRAYKKRIAEYKRTCAADDDSEHCNEARMEIPRALDAFGILDSRHPFFQIALHILHRPLLDDFRSASVFEAVADAPPMARLVKRRSLTMLYPASGSHLAVMVIPLKLIDSGKIDSAKLIYTEITATALGRIKSYLRWYEKRGMITGLNFRTVETRGGKEHHLVFHYKDKPVTLVYALNRGDEELFARHEHIQESDIVIFHDGIYDTHIKQASHFIAALRSAGGRRLVVSENQWDLPARGQRARIGDVRIAYRSVRGPYGCARRHDIVATSHRIVHDRIVDDDRLAEPALFPGLSLSHRVLRDGAVLIEVGQ